MQAILRQNGIDAYGPRNSIREIANLGLIEDAGQWFEFLTARNLIAHTYNEILAKQVYNQAKEFIDKLKDFINKVKNN